MLERARVCARAVDAAVGAGVELRESFSVQELITDGERVTGIRGRPATGSTVNESARIIIGADGMRSLVAREVQAPSYATKSTVACAYYGYFTDVPVDGVELYAGPKRAASAFGTNDSPVAGRRPRVRLARGSAPRHACAAGPTLRAGHGYGRRRDAGDLAARAAWPAPI
jgi:flavin-dependent dehydrogenase